MVAVVAGEAAVAAAAQDAEEAQRQVRRWESGWGQEG